MLGVGNQQGLVIPQWDDLALRARLPSDAADFSCKSGPLPIMPGSRRGYHRVYLRNRAILSYSGSYYGVYTLDVSRTGVGLCSPIQLLPCAEVTLWLSDGRELRLGTKVCIRLEEYCYRCGVLFSCND